MNITPKSHFRGQGFTISIIVTGKVQGVFFRQSTLRKAVELGITGEVRNLPNGNVSIIATGTKEMLNEIASWCRHGPPKAAVISVEKRDLSLQIFEDFSIQY